MIILNINGVVYYYHLIFFISFEKMSTIFRHKYYEKEKYLHDKHLQIIKWYKLEMGKEYWNVLIPCPNLKVLYIFFINFVVWVDHDLPYVTLESEWWSLLYPNLLTIFALLLESSSLAACSSVTIHSRQENFNHVCI